MRAALIVVGIALLAAATTARSAVLCATKGGQLVVRESCRKRQHVVKPDVFVVPGDTGPKGGAGGPGGPATFPLRLLDANDTEIGQILQFHSGQALVEIDDPDVGSPIVMFVYRNGFAQENTSLVYASNDCSGVPHKRSGFDDGPDIRPPLAQVWGLAAYYATGPRQDLAFASEEFFTSTTCSGTSVATGRGTCCRATSGNLANQVPAARIPLGSLGLVPPFHAVPR
jgi:hypothetical protein